MMPRKQSAADDPLDPIRTALPGRLPVMPVRSTVLFPTSATGLQVGFGPNVEVLTLNRGKSQPVVIVTTDVEEDEIDPALLEKVGVVARVLNQLNLPGGTIQATFQGLIRVHLQDVRFEDGHYSACVRLVEETPADEEEADRLIERILTTLGGVAAHVPRLADVPRILRGNVGDAGRFADLVATLAHFRPADKDAVLQRLDVEERLHFVLQQLQHEWERVQTIEEEEGSHPSVPRSKGRKPSRAERTNQIRKRIQALQAQLGQLDPAERESLTMLRRIERGKLPARVAAAGRKEAERLRTLTPSSSEATEIRNYIDALLAVPWDRGVEDPSIDLDALRSALDAKHLGLEDVKRKLLEIISVAKLRGDVRGLVPCVTGPPGVGKRSLVRALARGLDRPLARVELGGRGEAQLFGSRRGRNSTQPGKLIAAFSDAGVRDPVLLLEEMDEIGLGNVEGDPIEAMEEFLDPENRDAFIDRYLDVPFDMSDAIFVVTANDFFRIPRSLREYLIEIRIAGYTPEEKVEIARTHMLPRLIREHGLEPEEVSVADDALTFLTRGYARDSGLGNLRRALSAILRNLSLAKASGSAEHWTLDPAMIEEVLGIPRYSNTEAESKPEVGVVTGLAWTASGGELMFIEALKMPGTGRLIITGLLGDVMRESVNAAYSYVRSRAGMLGIPDEAFPEHDLHIHFPVGATPKDGPSAGAAVTLAIASSLSDRPVRHDIAMTGEVTLRGKILDIGGVKEKTLAAYRAGLREMILPTDNQRDLREVPDDVREGMAFHGVDHMDQVFELALLEKPAADEPRRRRPPRIKRTDAQAAAEGEKESE